MADTWSFCGVSERVFPSDILSEKSYEFSKYALMKNKEVPLGTFFDEK